MSQELIPLLGGVGVVDYSAALEPGVVDVVGQEIWALTRGGRSVRVMDLAEIVTN